MHGHRLPYIDEKFPYCIFNFGGREVWGGGVRGQGGSGGYSCVPQGIIRITDE